MRNELFQHVSRLVIKIGTGVLTDGRNQLSRGQVERLVGQVAMLVKAGKQVILVSSGAVGAGMGLLGLARRPREVAHLQACAAVGQMRLMTAYESAFARYGLQVGQVLLTHEDLRHKNRHLNARNTLLKLLDHGVVPIINENDTVSFTELKFGDNDRLSALVTTLLPADLLAILTTVEGLIQNFGRRDSQVVPMIRAIDAAVENWAGDTTSTTAIGGMSTKLDAARIVMRAGIPMAIISGRQSNALGDLLEGKSIGTVFVPHAVRMKGRKRWIAFFHHPKGSVYVDEGAKQALRDNGKSLLLPGISRCEGSFAVGDIIRICDLDGMEFARGITRHASRELRDKPPTRVMVVHRNDLVIL